MRPVKKNSALSIIQIGHLESPECNDMECRVVQSSAGFRVKSIKVTSYSALLLTCPLLLGPGLPKLFAKY